MFDNFRSSSGSRLSHPLDSGIRNPRRDGIPAVADTSGPSSSSAPSSPSLTMRSSSQIPRINSGIHRLSGFRHPVNICVEKGRIEFVKPGTGPQLPESPPPAIPALPATSRLGSKIFRPGRKVETQPEESGVRHLPPVKWKNPSALEASTSGMRDRSASPRNREPGSIRSPTPPLPEHKSLRKDIRPESGKKMLTPPRTTSIRAHETSPEVRKESPRTPKTSGGIPVPVSPNLIRWRNKIPSSSSNSPAHPPSPSLVRKTLIPAAVITGRKSTSGPSVISDKKSTVSRLLIQCSIIRRFPLTSTSAVWVPGAYSLVFSTGRLAPVQFECRLRGVLEQFIYINVFHWPTDSSAVWGQLMLLAFSTERLQCSFRSSGTRRQCHS